MTDKRYHVQFKDPYSKEELGLILTETPQVGLSRRLINPYAAKAGTGDTTYSDLTEWTVVAQEDWRGGRGQEKMDDPTAYYDSGGVDTRIEGQIILGPYDHAPAADVEQNENAYEGGKVFGHPAADMMADISGNGADFLPTQKYGQKVKPYYQSIPNADSCAYLEEVQVYLKKAAGFADGTTITLSIYSDSGGEPDSSLGSATISGSDVATSYAWETFTFADELDLSSHEEWWIVLEHDDAGAKALFWAYGPFEDVYPVGQPAYYSAATGWVTTPAEIDFLFKAYWAPVKLAQQFTTGASGYDVDSVSVYGIYWSKNVKVSLYSDSGDAPNAELKSAIVGSFDALRVGSGSTTTTIELSSGYTTGDVAAGMWVEINNETRHVSSVTDSDTFVLSSALTTAPVAGDVVYVGYPPMEKGLAGWFKVRFASAQTLTSTTKYWLVVEQSDADTSSALLGGWSKLGYGGSYASGLAKRKIGDNSWTSLTSTDFLFRLNDFSLENTITAYARFDDGWYAAGGDTVYKWNETNTEWDSKDQQADDEVTDLAVWGGKIWAARGSEHVLRQSTDGDSWSDVSGQNATLLKAGGGYLHFSGTGSNDHKVYYTSDGTNFSELGECGGGDHPVRGLAWYRDTLFAATDIELWSLAVEGLAYPVLDWSTQEDEHNGEGMETWNKTNCLYIPLRYGLYRWNGDSMVAVGPEQDAGLPEGRAGYITDLCPTTNWLFAAVDAGTNNDSSVLCYNGMGGWHEIARENNDAKSITTLGFSTLQTPSRLWFNLNDESRYCQIPDRSDNPYTYRGFAYNYWGYLITSWFGGELIEVVKDIHDITVRGENISSDQSVVVMVQVDRNTDTQGQPLWVGWGDYDQSPRQSIAWGDEDYHDYRWQRKLIGSSSTTTSIELDSDTSVSPINVGEFVRINGEISQVAAGSGTTITLASALNEAPSSGDYMYAAQPAGREFRLLIMLGSLWVGSYVAETPKVTAVVVRYQNNVLDRFLWTLQVRVQDGMEDLSGADYGLSAADLRVELDAWAKRSTPFTLVDPDGVEHTVKVTSAGEGGWARRSLAGGHQYHSTYSINLVEVA